MTSETDEPREPLDGDSAKSESQPSIALTAAQLVQLGLALISDARATAPQSSTVH